MQPVTNVSMDLRKLAAELRQQADAYDQAKTVKCALWVRSVIGLKLLQRKLGRKI
jgi:hypothetical protein